jgi:hypothetical protein
VDGMRPAVIAVLALLPGGVASIAVYASPSA